MNCDNDYLIPHAFTRHKLHLHALLLQNQPWFSARDLGVGLTGLSLTRLSE